MYSYNLCELEQYQKSAMDEHICICTNCLLETYLHSICKSILNHMFHRLRHKWIIRGVVKCYVWPKRPAVSNEPKSVYYTHTHIERNIQQTIEVFCTFPQWGQTTSDQYICTSESKVLQYWHIIERYPNNSGWLDNKCECNVWLTCPVTLTFADYTCPELYPTILCPV